MGIFDFLKPNRNVNEPQNKMTAPKEKSNPKVVKIVQGFKDSSRKDIDKWRNALTMTQLKENPRFDLYHDLIDDLLTDGHLQSQIQMRISSTLNTNFHIIDRSTGEVNEELTYLFQQQWFFEMIEQYLWSIIRGHKVLQFNSFQGNQITIDEIPQRHIVPTLDRIIPDLSDAETFIDMNDQVLLSWIIRFGKKTDLGIINNIIPAIIWKRNVEQSWAEFCERFGIPLITATTNTRDTKQVDDVHDMLTQIGEASAGTFPLGTDIKIHEANRTDAFRVFKEFIQVNTDSISKQLVGSTMLSDQGTNRSQTEVHERGLDDKIAQTDKREVQFMVNAQLLPILRLHGYNIPEDVVFEFKTTEQKTDVSELWKITEGLLNKNFPVEQDWISKTFNIPFDGVRKIDDNAPGEKKKNELTALLDERYPVSCCSHEGASASLVKVSQELIELTKQLAIAVFEGKDTLGIIGKLIAKEGNYLVSGVLRNFDSDKAYTGQDKLVMQMMEYNCFDFACSKTEERHFAVASRLIDYNKGEIKSKSDFIQACLKDNDQLNRNWLKSEYNLAVATGQNAAAYVRAVKGAKNGGTRFYEYQTMGDDLVRASHSILDGKVFDILESSDKAVYPPNGYGCRCELIPHVGGVKTTSWDDAKGLLLANDKNYEGSQFVMNRGDLKQVFTNKQFYRDIKGYPEKINQMSFEKYGLKKWESFKNSLKPLQIDKTITPDNIDELFKKNVSSKKMGFEDYLGRKIILTKSSFNRHKKRAELFPHVKSVLKTPDEVWLTKHYKKGFQTNYIKHYQNMSLLVSTTLNGELEATQIETWFDIDYQNKSLNRRTGILIKKKKGDD